MRSLAYGIASLSAVGIMVAIAVNPADPPAGDAPATTSSTTDNATTVAAPARVMEEAGTLTLNVPEMHCAVMCYPKVKKTLEAANTVEGVELAEQKEEGVLDNPQVVIKYDAGFDLDAAIAALEANGYANSDIVQ